MIVHRVRFNSRADQSIRLALLLEGLEISYDEICGLPRVSRWLQTYESGELVMKSNL